MKEWQRRDRLQRYAPLRSVRLSYPHLLTWIQHSIEIWPTQSGTDARFSARRVVVG